MISDSIGRSFLSSLLTPLQRSTCQCQEFQHMSKYLPLSCWGLLWLEFKPMSFSPTCLGPFWEDDLFGAQTKPLQHTILLYPQKFEEFAFYFSIFRYQSCTCRTGSISECLSLVWGLSDRRLQEIHGLSGKFPNVQNSRHCVDLAGRGYCYSLVMSLTNCVAKTALPYLA